MGRRDRRDFSLFFHTGLLLLSPTLTSQFLTSLGERGESWRRMSGGRIEKILLAVALL